MHHLGEMEKLMELFGNREWYGNFIILDEERLLQEFVVIARDWHDTKQSLGGLFKQKSYEKC